MITKRKLRAPPEAISAKPDGQPPEVDSSRAEKIFITPEIATAWLRNNPANRPKGMKAIRRIRRALVNSDWEINGETIKIDATGVLRDGQTRLQAIVDEEIAAWSWVIFDLGNGKGVYETIDQGRLRTLGHLLKIRGYQNYNVLASAIRTVYQLHPEVANASGLTANVGLGIIEDHPNINSSLVFLMGHQIRDTYSAGTAAGLHYLMSGKDSDAADYFWESLATGVFTTAASPARKVRDIIVANKNAKPDNKLTPTTIQALIIKAWNLQREGRTRKVLRWNSEKENFPLIG